METMDEDSVKSDRSCSGTVSVTPFSINDILNCSKTREETGDVQERALDMSKKWCQSRGEDLGSNGTVGLSCSSCYCTLLIPSPKRFLHGFCWLCYYYYGSVKLLDCMKMFLKQLLTF